MKSVYGSTILESAGIFDIQKNKKEAEISYNEAKSLYPDFKILILDMNKMEDRLKAIDIDPDLADMKDIYVILVEVPEEVT
ncbi:hypothetical protein D1867_03850 [Acidianus infernus]|uniref:Uncharacterized protein n=1 Tax=Acidianus infernus TaxID=12915 RepID=A0A6A9QAZ0_ACIIN|nr:hypothetical protein [Acidianus infernus]MCY0883656.1 hypothetical protein [Acidianus infernus]MUM64402.1 hypothetical protein [Acidianus infernus]